MIIEELIIQMIKDVNKLSEEKDSNRYIKKHPIEKVFLLLMLQQYSGFDNGRAFSLYTKKIMGDTTEFAGHYSEFRRGERSLVAPQCRR